MAFWVAVLISGAGMGTAIWLKKNNDQQQKVATDMAPRGLPPRDRALLELAQQLFEQNGTPALTTLLTNTKDLRFGKLYAIDQTGSELLNRSIDPAQAAKLWADLVTNGDKSQLTVATDSAGKQLLLFTDFQRRQTIATKQAHNNKPPEKFFRKHGPPPIKPMTLIVSLGLFSSLLLSLLLARYFAKPIRQLRSAQLALAEGKLDTRIGDNLTGNDELVELGHSFDFMAERLDSLVKSQQQLLHDVSHELRSPLARIQAAIGLAHQQPSKMEAMLPRIERETKKIDELVSELLLLARLQTNLNARHNQQVVLPELLAEIVEDVRFEAQSTPVTIQYEADCMASIAGDAELLQRAFENILRNALKYANSLVMVRLKCLTEATKPKILVTIADDGPGINEADQEQIFEPFFRSQTQQRVPGVGLGLTIANRAIRVHQGSIQVANREQGGLEVRVTLPKD